MSLSVPTCLIEPLRPKFDVSRAANERWGQLLLCCSMGTVWIHFVDRCTTLVDRSGNKLSRCVFVEPQSNAVPELDPTPPSPLGYLCSFCSLSQTLDVGLESERAVISFNRGSANPMERQNRVLGLMRLQNGQARLQVQPPRTTMDHLSVSPNGQWVVCVPNFGCRVFRHRLNSTTLEKDSAVEAVSSFSGFPKGGELADNYWIGDVRIDDAGNVAVVLKWRHDEDFHASFAVWPIGSESTTTIDLGFTLSPWYCNSTYSSTSLQNVPDRMRVYVRDPSHSEWDGKTARFFVCDVRTTLPVSFVRLGTVSRPPKSCLAFWHSVGNSPDSNALHRLTDVRWSIERPGHKFVRALTTDFGAPYLVEARIAQSNDCLVYLCLSNLAKEALRDGTPSFQDSLPDEELRNVARGFWDWHSLHSKPNNLGIEQNQ